MEENPFSEANSYSADKEITSIWCDLKADKCVHKNLQADNLSHQKNQVHTFTLRFFNILSHTRRIKSTPSHPISLKLLCQENQIHFPVLIFFNTLS